MRFDLLLNDWDDWYHDLKTRPLENYISWSPWKFSFAVGFQEFDWGIAGGIDPADNIDPRDYTTGTDADKLSILAADIKYAPFDFMSLEAVYIPSEEYDIFKKVVESEIPAAIFYGKILTIPAMTILDYLLNDYKIRNHKISWVAGFDLNAGSGDLSSFNFRVLGEFIPLFDDRFYKDYTDGSPDDDRVDWEDPCR